MTPEDNDLIVINEDEAGERLDKILANRFQSIKSRTYFQYLIEERKVLVNGEPAKKRLRPKVGDEVQVEFIVTKEIGLEPEAIPLDIVYEDHDILVINKPAGMVVHPAVGNWTGTFVNALLYHCQNLLENHSDQTLRPGIVHRLDKNTSGLLIAAKTSDAHQKLIEMFSSKKVYKEYLAICVGNPGNQEINAPIGRHPVERKMMAVVKEGGKEALSIVKTLAHHDKLSLVSVILATGRTHQIRVHVKSVGTPILGDDVYGNASFNKKYGVSRQMLHAYVLKFIHPISGKELEFKVPPPQDMQAIINHYKLLR